MKKIELKEICSEVEITLNNLRDCEIEEADGTISVVFGRRGMSLRDESESGPKENETDEG
ncbi:MAG: hypothetical protein IPM63_04345 [Acidobacteriota bacterium]|nr:MAG: hypothetical protein IPM63_04345 [Acidobacteriota bacterium]